MTKNKDPMATYRPKPKERDPEHYIVEESERYMHATYGPNDVILGKGNGINFLPGNRRFRAIVDKYKPRYASAVRCEKGGVADLVFAEMAMLDPPAKFLVQVGASKKFVEVTKQRQREKVCQALREKKVYRQSNKKKSVSSPEDTDTPSSAAMAQAKICSALTMIKPITLKSARIQDRSSKKASDRKPAKLTKSSFRRTPSLDLTKAELPARALEDQECDKQVGKIRSKDILFWGQGRICAGRLANKRYMEHIKSKAKEYAASTAKHVFAHTIYTEWEASSRGVRFLHQDVAGVWHIMPKNLVLDRMCQTMRDHAVSLDAVTTSSALDRVASIVLAAAETISEDDDSFEGQNTFSSPISSSPDVETAEILTMMSAVTPN